MRISPRQAAVLVVLTVVWGLNWPVMKLGVSGWPPLSFRALSMWLGLPVLAGYLWWRRLPLTVPRAHWGELLALTVPNMLVWHVLVIVALPALSSGRAAILGYTMPVFAALWGMLAYGERLAPRQALGVAAAALAVVLLLWHEFTRLAGAPLAAAAVVFAAAVWAYGTHRIRRTTIPVPVLTVALWMTGLTAAVVAALAVVFEAPRWHAPSGTVTAAVLYNAIGVFGFAHAAWFTLARNLPPVASTISVMLIPVLGTFSGAWWLSEALHWQEFAAMALIVLAIAAVLRPRGSKAAAGA